MDSPATTTLRKFWSWIGTAALVAAVVFLVTWLSSIHLVWLAPVVAFLLATGARLYISIRKSRKISRNQNVDRGWDLIAYARKMKQSKSPVSAFFLIDSLEAISKCLQWLSYLKPFDFPDMTESQYFKDVREFYKSGKEVMNFDHSLRLLWKNTEYPGLLRFHFIAQGKYEIELLLPGVVANEVADKFGDGQDGFFCAFLPPGFYD